MPANSNTNFLARLTKDVEIKQSQNGVLFGHSSIAVDRQVKNREGKYDTIADFFNITIIGPRTQHFAQYVKKGDYVVIQAHPQSEPYEKNGIKIPNVVFYVDDFSFVPNRRNSNGSGQNTSGGQNGNYQRQGNGAQIQGSNQNYSQNQSNNQGQPVYNQNANAAPAGMGGPQNGQIASTGPTGNYQQPNTPAGQSQNTFGIDATQLPWDL